MLTSSYENARKMVKNVVMELLFNDFDCEEHSSVFDEKKIKENSNYAGTILEMTNVLFLLLD